MFLLLRCDIQVGSFKSNIIEEVAVGDSDVNIGSTIHKFKGKPCTTSSKEL